MWSCALNHELALQRQEVRVAAFSNSSPITVQTVVLGVNFTHRQRRAAIYRCLDCLRCSAAASKTSLPDAIGRHPCARNVSLQKLRDFLFGKIGTFCVGVTFRNAAAVSKGDHVEIATLGVNNTNSSVVSQTSLNDRAIPIFNPFTVLAEVCPRRAHDYVKGENQRHRSLHTFHSNIWPESATRLRSLNCLFLLQTLPKRA